MQEEKQGFRDIVIYLRDPQIITAQAPHELFIDPSYTFRLNLKDYQPQDQPHHLPFVITPIEGAEHPVKIKSDNLEQKPMTQENIQQQDIQQIEAIYVKRNMIAPASDFWRSYTNQSTGQNYLTYWVVRDQNTSQILAVAMSIDHHLAFNDPEYGCSIWALAVDPQAVMPGLGFNLMAHIIQYFKNRQRKFIDVSVLHTNTEAMTLYKKLGFTEVPVFCVKNKNSINEQLFIGPQPTEQLNPYAEIIVKEAQRRGIKVEVINAAYGYFRLSYGATSFLCRESLSDLTSAVTMSLCADKQLSSALLQAQGIRVPDQQLYRDIKQAEQWLKKYQYLVVKPAKGEQGQGISLRVNTIEKLTAAIQQAGSGYADQKILLEEMVFGVDLRILVIGYEVVAAAVRHPPFIVGDGHHTVAELVTKQSRRRQQATKGESRILIDDVLKRTSADSGLDLHSVLPNGKKQIVRHTANLHQGGTIHDVTSRLHPELAQIAVKIAEILAIPVTGLDFIVAAPDKPDYYFIEANERPGLANHEPQPTAEKFIDLLFPHSMHNKNA